MSCYKRRMRDFELNINPITAADLPAVLRLSTEAGWNQVEADWSRLVRLCPDLCLAGRMNGDLVATTTVAKYGSTGWVGMVLVDPAWQGRGIGKALLARAMGVAESVGISTLGLDATEPGRPIYLKASFADSNAIARWRRAGTAMTCFIPPTPVLTEDEWFVVLAMDRAATGLDRRLLLKHLAAEPGVRVEILRAGRTIRGLYILRPGRTAWHLGPVLAWDAASAESLIASAAHACGDAILIDVVAGSTIEPALAAAGFIPARHLMRMYRPACGARAATGDHFAGSSVIGFEWS